MIAGAPIASTPIAAALAIYVPAAPAPQTGSGAGFHWRPRTETVEPARVLVLGGVARVAVWVRTVGDFIPARHWLLESAMRLGGPRGESRLRHANPAALRERIERKMRLLGL